jgi:predicted alpha/beta superfamily hydrolase
MALVGTLHRHPAFPSALVEPRNVDVWLPPSYSRDPDGRFPVVYMHDGQNLFDPELAFGGVDWGMDEAIVRLIEAGDIGGAIVVGVWNREDGRWPEYIPQKALAAPGALEAFRQLVGSEPLSDRYLRFLVREVKPFVDETYRTLPERESTLVMGSSMGALISLHALCEYPQVFVGAGCLSTHWPAGDGIVIETMRRALPPPGTHRLYFDYGTETLDAEYEPYQRQADAVMREAGYREGVDWMTRRFPGAEHSERSWRERVHIPLRFLLEDHAT